MSAWRQLTHGLRNLLDRKTTDAEIADEVQAFLEHATAEGMARGLSEEQARRAARLELGSPTAAREGLREIGWENRLESLVVDLRYAARRLRAAPGFTLAAALTLAIGIGAATTIVSAVEAILVSPLPYPRADRLMMLWDRSADGSRADVAFGTFHELADRARGFESLAVLRSWQPTWAGATEPERLEGQRVTADYFRMLGIRPRLGRDFEPDDDRPNAPRVALLSDALWHRGFGADPAVVGRTLSLDGESHLILGVLPHGFVNALAPEAEVWAPLGYDLSLGSAWGHHLQMVGRLRPGVEREAAARELDLIARTPRPEMPRPAWASLEHGLLVRSLQAELTREIRPSLLLLLGAVLLLATIATVNVTQLLFARGLERRGELALRAALGAGRSRLVRQLFTESLLLALLGGLGGVALAGAGLRALTLLAPPSLPQLGSLAIDGRVLLFGLVLTVWVGLAVGLSPALRAGGRDPRLDLALASRRSSGGQRRTRGILVVCQVALALLLLVGTGLLLRSLVHLLAVDTGFAPENLLTLQVDTAGSAFTEGNEVERYFEQALAAVERVPGVAAAAMTSLLPMSGEDDRYGVHLESDAGGRPEGSGDAFRYAVSPGFIETMGIPLLRGRRLDGHDRPGGQLVALISESLARRRFPGRDPLGKRLHLGPVESPAFTVVGIVGDVKQRSLALDEGAAVYIPSGQWRFADRARWLVVRARGDAATLADAVRRAIRSIDAAPPIVRLATMEQRVTDSAADRRFVLLLLATFALAALLLAGAGLYGVIAGSVAERTREVGVRSALGATRGEIVTLVLREGLTLTGLGIALGSVAAAVMADVLATLLYGVSPLDPLTYLGVATLLVVTAAAACAQPVWRATKIDPAGTLRAP